MTEFWEPPEEYHVLFLAGICFFIDEPTRLCIEAWLQSKPEPFAICKVTTVTGQVVSVMPHRVGALYSQSPGIRRREQAILDANESDSGEAWK